MHDMLDRAKETFHSTSLEAAQIAKEMNITTLLIGHFSARYRDLSPLLLEARSVFEETYLANEGETFVI
jgi:ribonuclease Z